MRPVAGTDRSQRLYGALEHHHPRNFEPDALARPGKGDTYLFREKVRVPNRSKATIAQVRNEPVIYLMLIDLTY
jgi:hypothetical protein